MESEVPESLMHVPSGVSITWPFRSSASVEALGIGPVIARPGALSSGFAKPSYVYPQADHGATLVCSVFVELCRSSAPTVTTNGSFAGAKPIRTGLFCDWPSLPADATTVTPENQSFSTALSSGSHRKLDAVAEWSERFATRMSYSSRLSTIHCAAAITSLVRAMPWSSMTSSETIPAVGAAPV